MKQKINLHASKTWAFLYPIYARQFLLGFTKYEQLADEISKHFELTPAQWEAVLEEWEFKEMILTEK